MKERIWSCCSRLRGRGGYSLTIVYYLACETERETIDNGEKQRAVKRGIGYSSLSLPSPLLYSSSSLADT